MRDPEDPVKDAAPGIVLRAKKMDPAVKSGDSDLPVITKICHSIRTVKICEQDGKYKSQGIGPEGDERIREKASVQPQEPHRNLGTMSSVSEREPCSAETMNRL